MRRSSTSLDLERLDARGWAELDRVLEVVLELTPEAVEPALDRLCGENEELKERVRTVLAADREGVAAEFLSKPPLEMAEAPLTDGLAEAPSRARTGDEPLRIGPFRILQEIGRGGMGRVFLAERADGQYEQKVAIKLLKRGLDSDDILARFIQERQILARLEHPHIARLLDGGVTADGLPWFALEHVDGKPIDLYVRESRDTLAAMLRLFIQACRAVQFAHRNLVVHRDLKPSNIHVSTTGEVKLLDFGIAKLLDPADSELPGQTIGPARLMTPIYAAPEQVRGEPPTTATDVYALGVVLYELLTGELPYRKPTGTLEEARTAILEEIPEAPSARLKRLGTSARRADWRRTLHGDLDNILLQALRKEPESRYASAEALADDLERYIDGRPVRATGRRFGYVLRKFIERNRLLTGAGLLLMVSVIGGLVATTWQARRAAHERDRAMEEAERAQTLKEFSIGLFTGADPEQSRGDTITVREVLEQGAGRVENALRGQPPLQAEMWTVLGDVYKHLGRTDRALPLYERALSTRRRLYPGDDSLVSKSLVALGQCLISAGEYARADSTYREALSMRRRLHGPVSAEVAYVLGDLAQIADRLGRPAQAESLYRETLRMDSLTIGFEHPDAVVDLGRYGAFLTAKQRYREALPYLERDLAIQKRLYGEKHLKVAAPLERTSNTLARVGEFDRAIPMKREAQEIRRRWLPPDHPELAIGEQGLGVLLMDRGEYAQAEPHMREALRIWEKANGPTHPLVGVGHHAVGIVSYRAGKLDSAAVHFREAIRIWSLKLPPDHPNLMTMRYSLAVIAKDRGRYVESEREMRDVLARRIAKLGPQHPDVADSWLQLGNLQRALGRPAEAEEMIQRSLAMRKNLLEPDNPKIAEAEGDLADLRRAQGRYAESEALFDSALAITRRFYRGGHPQIADHLVGKARLLMATGRADAAEPLLREAIAIREHSLVSGDPRRREAAALLKSALAQSARAQTSRAQTARASLP